MRKTLSQIRTQLAEAGPASVGELSRRARAVVYLARLWPRILKQWAHDRCPQQAAALAFQTALSLVPILAVGFALLRSMGQMGAESQLLGFLATRVFPDLDDITSNLQSFSEKISIGAAGGAGLFFTLGTCYSLYSSVEKIFNDVWKVGTRRSLVGKFLTFYALVTLLPVLATVSLYWSGKFFDANGEEGKVVPLLLQVAALFLTNKLLPNTSVRWRAALAGALVTGVALEAMKFAFLKFAKQMLLDTYKGVYGPLGLVPMMLVWIYLSWLLVLLGAEIANAIQNMKLLEAEDRRRLGEEPVNGLIGAQLLALVAADFERGGKGLTREALGAELALSADVVGRITERLKARGLVAEVQGDKEGLIPARSASSVEVTDILACFRASDLETARGPMSPALTALVQDLETSRKQRIADLTLADLLPEMAAERTKPREEGAPRKVHSARKIGGGS